jgi:hypothetical protein
MRRQQLDAEFLQGRFRDRRRVALVLGKQENRIRKLPSRRVTGKPTVDAHQCRPSDVKRLEKALKRAGKPYDRKILTIPRPLFPDFGGSFLCSSHETNRYSTIDAIMCLA